MKNLVLIGVFLLSTTALGSAVFGGIGSGGGEITTPAAVSAEQIKDFLKTSEAQVAVRAFFNREEWMWLSGERNLPSSLFFRGKRNVEEALIQLKINLNMGVPCFDRNGNPREGSAQSSLLGAEICLSPYLLSSELNQSNYQSESLALLVHELAHIFGATEEQAVNVQEMALEAFRIRQSDDVNASFTDTIGSIERLFLTPLNYWSRYPKKLLKSPEEIQRFFGVNFSEFAQEYSVDGSRLMVLNGKEFKKLKFEELRTYILEIFLCSFDSEKEKDERQQCQSTLDKVFKNNKVASFDQISRSLGISFGIQLGEEAKENVMRQPEDLEGLRRELKVEWSYFSELRKQLLFEQSHRFLVIER